jgi:hypothetical protein
MTAALRRLNWACGPRVMTWYGSVRALFTFDFLEELLRTAGFREVRRCAHGQTADPYPEIVELDNRPRESLIVEGVK